MPKFEISDYLETMANSKHIRDNSHCTKVKLRLNKDDIIILPDKNKSTSSAGVTIYKNKV